MEMTQKQQALDAIMNLINEYNNEHTAMWKERSEIVDTTRRSQMLKMEQLTRGIKRATHSINALHEAYEKVRFL